MIVTRTEPINKTKYAVSIDGEFAFVLYKGELHKYGIAPVSYTHLTLPTIA